MTPRQLEILQHALGCDKYGKWPKGHDWYYRDYYIGECEVCDELVALGFMSKFVGNAATGGDVCYRVTGNGIVAMRGASTKRPTLTRSQTRYQEFLDASDAFNCSFREFLDMQKQPWYREMKNSL